MADIDVVPKGRTNVWLWIVLAIVVVAVLWWAFGRNHTPVRTGANLGPVPTTLAIAIDGARFA